MIEIRELTEMDMEEAIGLRSLCWTEELAGKAENTLSVEEELEMWVDWMNSAEENNDIRMLVGAFEGERMLGVAFSSFAEIFDIPERGVELNGLWVYPDQRGRGISLIMMVYILDFYLAKGMERIVIYNHHYAPSNQFYHKFGAKVHRQEYQLDGSLLIDVFLADMEQMKRKMEQSLKRYIEV